MIRRAQRRDKLPELIFDMDAGVSALVGWALAVRDLGTTDHNVSPEGLAVIGDAMVEQARAVQEDWERCFELSRAAMEGTR